LPTKLMGLVFAAMIIFSYIGSQLSKFWLKVFICEKKAIILSQAITLIGISICLISTNFPIFLSFFMIHEFGRGLSTPISRAYINKIVESKNRATILSFESMIIKVGSAIGLIFSGLIANNFGALSSWLSSAIILTIIIFIFWKRR
jgi:MFS family permease